MDRVLRPPLRPVLGAELRNALLAGAAAGALTGGALLLEDEAAGLGMDFTVSDGLGSVAVKGHTTNQDNVPAADFLTNAGTSTKWVLNSSGVYVEKAAETPVIEWDSVASAAAGEDRYYLLVEPAATNLLLRSSEFDNAAWTTADATVTANDAVAPDGTTTADKLVFAGNGGTDQIYQQYTGAAVARTLSGFIKGTVGETVTLTDGLGGGATLHVLTGEWDRVTVQTSSENPFFSWWITSGTETARTVWVWGAQLETGTVATSPIPTAGSTVTRAADVISVAVTEFPFSATVGTLIARPQVFLTSTSNVVQIDDGTTGSRFVLSSGQFLVNVSSALQAQIVGTATTTDDKLGAAWAANDFEFVKNGVGVGTDTSGTLPTVMTLRLGHNTAGASGQKIKTVVYLPRRMTNVDLVTRTAA